MSDRVCTECVFCRHDGVGYSEWTITGERLTCMFGLMTEVDTDTDPDEKVREATKRAETCKAFREGTGLRSGLFGDGDEEQEAVDWIACALSALAGNTPK